MSHNNKPTIIVTCVSFGCHIKDEPFSPADCEWENRRRLWGNDFMDGRRMRVFFYCRFFFEGVVVGRLYFENQRWRHSRMTTENVCLIIVTQLIADRLKCVRHLLSSISFSLSALTVSPGERALLLMSLYISGVTEKTKGVKWKLKAVDKSRYISAAANKRKGKKKKINEETREVESETCKISHRVRRSRRIKSKVGINGITKRER